MAAHFISLAQMVCLVVLLRAGLAKDIPEEYHFEDNAASCQNSYTLFMQPKSFRDAMNHCQQIGGVLAPQKDREVKALKTSGKAKSLDFVWMRGNCDEIRIHSDDSYFTQCTKKNAFICKQVLKPEDVEKNNVKDTVSGGVDQCPGHGGSVQVVDSSSPNTIYSLILLGKTFEEARQYCIDRDQEMAKMNSEKNVISELLRTFRERCPEMRLAYQAVWNDGTCMGKDNPSDVNSYGSDDCDTDHPYVCKESKKAKACLPDTTDGYSFKTSKHSYRLFTVKKSYFGAKDHCESIGGQLAPWDSNITYSLEDLVNCQCVGNAWESGPLWIRNYTQCDVYFVFGTTQFNMKQERSCNAKASFVCKNNSLNQGVQYQLVRERMTFENAIGHCGKKGRTVASFDTDKKAILSKAKKGSFTGYIWNSMYQASAIGNPQSEFMNWISLPTGQLNGFICQIDSDYDNTDKLSTDSV